MPSRYLAKSILSAKQTQRNGISYRADEDQPPLARLFVSETQLSRDASAVKRGSTRGRTLAFPRTVRRVQCVAFRSAESLRSVVLNEGLEALGDRAFYRTGLREVAFPASLRKTGKGTFAGCESLRRVTFAAGSVLERIEGECFSGTGIDEIVVPSSIAVIGGGAFRGCSSLRRVAFQKGSKLQRIGHSCFCGSGLEEVALPGTLRAVGGNAFGNCGRLRAVWVEAGCQVDVRELVGCSVEVEEV